MLKTILDYLAARQTTGEAREIKSLKEQLAASRFFSVQMQNQYLVLADDHADLRAAYSRLQHARLADHGLDALFTEAEHGGRSPHQSNRGT